VVVHLVELATLGGGDEELRDFLLLGGEDDTCEGMLAEFG
jgi:hypothetical protein